MAAVSGLLNKRCRIYVRSIPRHTNSSRLTAEWWWLQLCVARRAAAQELLQLPGETPLPLPSSPQSIVSSGFSVWRLCEACEECSKGSGGRWFLHTATIRYFRVFSVQRQPGHPQGNYGVVGGYSILILPSLAFPPCQCIYDTRLGNFNCSPKRTSNCANLFNMNVIWCRILWNGEYRTGGRHERREWRQKMEPNTCNPPVRA